MSKVRCDICNGQRKILGSGGMKKDCYKCGGTGSVSVVAAQPVIKHGKSKKE